MSSVSSAQSSSLSNSQFASGFSALNCFGRLMVMSSTWGSGIDNMKYCAEGNCIVKGIERTGNRMLKGEKEDRVGFMYSFSHLSNAKCGHIHTMMRLSLIQQQDDTHPANVCIYEGQEHLAIKVFRHINMVFG